MFHGMESNRAIVQAFDLAISTALQSAIDHPWYDEPVERVVRLTGALGEYLARRPLSPNLAATVDQLDADDFAKLLSAVSARCIREREEAAKKPFVEPPATQQPSPQELFDRLREAGHEQAAKVFEEGLASGKMRMLPSGTVVDNKPGCC